MWLMLQQEEPGDYVIATGEGHSVREFLEISFSHLGLDPYDYLEIDERFYRPSEVMLLEGDTSKAQKILGWKYQLSFENLVKEMTESDLSFFGNC